MDNTTETSCGILANKLKTLRRQRQLTLQALSKRSGISTATLSKIENGRLSPTYEKIIALAKGLEVKISALFGNEVQQPPGGRRSVVRSGGGVPYHSAQYAYELLHTDLNHKRFTPMLAVLKAHERSEFPRLHHHEGEEFFYVLSGRVTLYTEYYTPVTLDPGDSCYLDSSMGHACISASEQDAHILWISYTVSFATDHTDVG